MLTSCLLYSYFPQQHFKDSNWHSTEGDKRDDLSSNKWFNQTQKLAGDKKFIKKTGNWACECPPPQSAFDVAALAACGVQRLDGCQ